LKSPERGLEPRLELLREAKLHEILGRHLLDRLEASGVTAKDGLFYVVFDSSTEIASVHGELDPYADCNGIVGQGPHGAVGYEDIAHDPGRDRFYALVEARRRGDIFMAQVDEYDESFRHAGSAWLDFPLDQANKGIEGLTCVQREGRTYLLGLCEGNRCRGGASGRRVGEGRINVFCESERHWDHVDTIRLPESLRFKDYSSLALSGNRIAVVSQESSALWLSALLPSSWNLASEGSTYWFPRDDRGRPVYCNVEGVSWLASDRVVVVSDRVKAATQRRGCRAKDQSIHLFAIRGRS
jgi:hypothetical protein